MRDGKWKLVSSYPSLKWELYDLEKDRGETKDVAAAFPEVVNRLSAAYFEWAKTHDVVDYEKIKPEREIRVSARKIRK